MVWIDYLPRLGYLQEFIFIIEHMHLNQKIFREDNIVGNQQKLFETMPGTKPILLKNQVEPRNMEWTHCVASFLRMWVGRQLLKLRCDKSLWWDWLNHCLTGREGWKNETSRWNWECVLCFRQLPLG